jgi:hypothetical protein
MEFQKGFLFGLQEAEKFWKKTEKHKYGNCVGVLQG